MDSWQKRSLDKLKEAREKLEKMKGALMPLMDLVDLPTLEAFLNNARFCTAGPLGPFNKENITLLIKSLDEKLLLERGLFFLSEKQLDLSEIKKVDDESRLVGLLANGQWLVVRVYMSKIAKIPNPDIELRDCFDVARIGDRLNNRDCADILLNDRDLYKLIGKFSADIKSIASALESKVSIVKICQKKIEECLFG